MRILKPIIQNLQTTSWQAEFVKPAYLRTGFSQNDYPQIAGVVLGVPDNDFEYYQWLYDTVYDNNYKVRLLTGNLDKQIDNQVFQGIQKIFNIHNEQNLSASRFVAFMQGNNLLPLENHPDYYYLLSKKMIELIEIFKINHQTLQHKDFRRIMVDCIKWGFSYVDKWLKIDLTKEVPKIIWYGKANKSEQYFLCLLYLLGFDLLIFDSEKQNPLQDIKGISLPLFHYDNAMPFKPFPTDKPRKTATIAKQASVELHNVLSSNVLFKPFQLRDHSVSSITLQTTYDEIYIIGKEKALLRPHFEMSATTVTIPVLFAKVLGIEINTIKYWADFHKLQRDSKLRQVFRTFPIKKEMKGNQKYHYQFALENGTLKPEKMLQASWWTYKEISYSAQMALANAICRYVMKNNLLAQQGESVDDMRLYLFSQAMNIPQSIIKLLQQFDYSQDIPKVIVYNNGYQFARQDAALLLLVNELGFDVILYNPSGQNDLELYINSDKIDSHWLSEINFNEDFQEDNTSTFFNFLRRKI